MADRIGFAGLGTMGGPIAARLVGAGHDVTVYNRSAGKATALAARGATVADDPAQLAQHCDVVFGCLLDDAAIRAVYLGEDGLLSHARQGQVFVEHGTFSAGLRGEVEERAASRGAVFVDGPVTGGPEGARAGTLVCMAGGPEDVIARLRPLMLAYSTDVVRAGPAGAGLRLKVVNQLLVSCHAAAAGLGVALLRATGIPLTAAADVLNNGWAASTMLRRALDAASSDDPATTSGAPVRTLLSVRTAIEPALAEADIDSAVYSAAARLLTDAEQAGHGGMDISRLFTVLGRSFAVSQSRGKEFA